MLATEGTSADITSHSDLTVIILTLNEEHHILRCITSVRDIAKRVVVIDSGSTDGTRDLARDLGADVLVNPFESHARQFNWGLKNSRIDTKWIMKLDADEYLTPSALNVISCSLEGLSEDVTGITLNLRRIFLGKWLKHGSLYPIRLLRIWRFGRGQIEERWMDEHVSVDGRVVHLKADFADHNLGTLTSWVDKHNRYASREVVELLNLEHGFLPRDAVANLGGGRQAGMKRWLKERVYARLPGGFRAFVYFVYRYIVRLGFLDGREGTAFHVLQGFWYRYLVDMKLHEVKTYMRAHDVDAVAAIRDVLGIKLNADASKKY
ncbi:glycosyltransferase family 2 protein [Pseudosulfitobacter pseudonitzschiae]|uniref:glycosyltransferase family 2 protein n=1 Tax=Pseudosulfitobacter pseudonitzschiae TaxID=1402135 RepID=UPI003B771827